MTRSAKAWMYAPPPKLTEQQRREDAYWCPPQAACIKCGDVDDLPKGVEYDEYVCGSCQRTESDEEEAAEAEAWLQHMQQVTEGKQ